MILTSPCDQEEKEQRHGVINARETACWKRGCPSVPLCPEEGERDHAAGDHCYTLTVTDRCSGWTQMAPVPRLLCSLLSRPSSMTFPVPSSSSLMNSTPLSECSSWRSSLLSVPTFSSLPWPSWRRGSRIQKRYHAPVTPLHRLLQAPEVSDQAKARLLRQFRNIDPLSLQRDIGILQARLLRKISSDFSLKAVTEQTVSL